MIELTEKGLELFRVLKENQGLNMTAGDIADAMNQKGGNPVFGSDVKAIQINGAANALIKQGLAERIEDVITETNEKGKEVSKTVKYIQLTDEGKVAEPVLRQPKPKKSKEPTEAEG